MNHTYFLDSYSLAFRALNKYLESQINENIKYEGKKRLSSSMVRSV